MHRTVTNSFARGEELNQQLYAGYDTREDPDVEIFTRERSHADIPSALQWRQSCRAGEPLPPGDPADDY